MKLGKLFSGVALAAVLILAAGAAQAADSSLTPEQRDRVQRIIDDNYAAMDANRDALDEKRARLAEEMANPNPDSATIERLSREIGELRGKMLAARAKIRAELAKNGVTAAPYAPNRGEPGDGPRYYSRGYHHGGYHHDGYHHSGRGYWRGGCPCY